MRANNVKVVNWERSVIDPYNTEYEFVRLFDRILVLSAQPFKLFI